MDEHEKRDERAADEDLELPRDDAEQVTGGAGTFDLTFKGQTASPSDGESSQWIRVGHPH